MPIRRPIAAPLREALIECFAATTRLVRPSLRRQLYTEDLDVAAPPEALQDIWGGVMDGTLNFKLESDGKIRFNAPQGFQVKLDLLELGADPINRIHATELFLDGSVASMSDLLLLRAVTVVDRGSKGDLLDFDWLLSKVVEIGNFPKIDNEEFEVLVEAVETRLGRLGRLLVAAFIGSINTAAAERLIIVS
ncbi:hypothetical protein DM02DRAFT_716339 [Periconia macrospinosa]|uniref:Uncharacterized protein n=1 Tax=Periconia macrospinosa TaxID=97972 RepID=A0A2V1E515_9PLEO|nr:hypothetical protein DM02DRAFT_716339 [Periconia macrospinosa]